MDAVKEQLDKVVDGVSKVTVEATEQVKQATTDTKQKTKKTKPAASSESGPLELTPPPSYLQDRINLFDKVQAEHDAWVAKQPRDDITITLGNGTIKTGKAWEITPGEIAREISKSLFERTVIAKLDGKDLWDMERPLEKSCTLELLDFEHPEGKRVFWHSSAHVLGEACERRFGCSLCIGPPIDDGFYYEMALPENAAVTPGDWKPLEKIVDSAIKEKQKFQRLVLTKEQLLEMFKYNKYKQHIIKDKIPDGTSTTVYRNGPLIDLCAGPHVANTGRIKAFEIMKASSSYFLGDAKNDSLQRIYGVSFPDKKQLAEHKVFLEEAAKRDHRKIGERQELFFFHEKSPGSPFFLPHGMIIFNALQTFLRSEYWRRGYQEVMSPNMYNSSLWKQSGHWQHYKDDMFTFKVEKDDWALKPMNCPGHCLLFAHRARSHRELPMRIADFGVLHRNEASGALSGLTRVRRFQQDDSHIFCTEEQVETEIAELFDFLKAVYGQLGFTFKMKLSTRPEGHLGEIETWDKAEAQLKKALDDFVAGGGAQWELNEGDGAFYGPKIDITMTDALRREFQCATIQLDFQLPQQFNLEFRNGESEAETKQTAAERKTNADAKPAVESAQKSTSQVVADAVSAVTSTTEAHTLPSEEQTNYRKELTPGCSRPVMIHRAIYGSFERFIAMLTEHFAGKWPFWLSPRQVLIIPVMPAANDYVLSVQSALRQHMLHADVDISGNTMQYKIRQGQLAQYNFILVLGAKEQEAKCVNIRNRDVPESQKMGELVGLDEFVTKVRALRDERRLKSEL